MNIQAEIVAARFRHGAGSPIGRRLSMLGEQVKNNVPVQQTLDEIAQLKRDGGMYVHAHHIALSGAERNAGGPRS